MLGISLIKILQIPLLSEAQVLAGSKNLDRYVTSVAVAEVPDIVNLAKKNTIYLSTLFAFKDENSQRALVKGLAEKKAAALFIKPKRFFREVPKALIEEAAKIGFPVILVDEKVMWSDLIKVILEEMINEESREKLIRNILSSIIGGIISGENEEVFKDQLGIGENNLFSLILISLPQNKNISPEDAINEEERISWKIKNYFEAKKINLFSLPLSRFLLALIAFKNESEIDYKKAFDYIRKAAGKDVFLYISKPFKRLTEASKHYKRLFFLARSGLSHSLTDSHLFFEEELIDDLLILNLAENNASLEIATDYYEKISAKLPMRSAEKIIQTVYTYLLNDLSKLKTARTLNIHPNTVKYRIELFEKLTGFDLKKSKDVFRLTLLLRLVAATRGFFKD